MDKRARSHHFIPEFHLLMFTRHLYRRVHVYDKKWGKYGKPPAANSAVLRDYYLLPGSTIEERLSLERQFSLLENLVAPLMRRLDRQPFGHVDLSEAERDGLAGNMAILHVRGPAYRDAALARARFMAGDLETLGLADRDEFRDRARDFGIAGDDEELEAMRVQWSSDILSGKREFKVPKSISLYPLTPAVEKGRPILIGRHWELLRSSDPFGFVIGDQPVCLLAAGLLAPSIGFGTTGVQVLMPISWRTLLLVSDRPRESVLQVKEQPRRLGLAEPWWATVNRAAWLTAQRWIWGHAKRDLQATELLIRPEDRRRDIRILDPDTEARVAAEARGRMRAHRATRRATRRKGSSFHQGHPSP